MDTLGISEALFRALMIASRQVTSHVEQELADTAGLSLPEFEILHALATAPDGRARAGELGMMLAWEKSRTSHQVTRMERRGLVARFTCESDQRGTWVVLSPAGADAVAAAEPAYRAAVGRALESIAGTQDGDAFARAALEIGRQLAPGACQSAVDAVERDLPAAARV